MKTPADYVAAVLPGDYATHPAGYLLTPAQAEAAVAAALADSRRYHELLGRALRNAQESSASPASPT